MSKRSPQVRVARNFNSLLDEINRNTGLPRPKITHDMAIFLRANMNKKVKRKNGGVLFDLF